MFRVLPILVACWTAVAAVAAPVQTDYVEAELVLRESALVPGEKALAGLRMKIAPHWHTYWFNPGDSGAPTSIEWKLPPGIEAGPIQWPEPKRIPVPPLMNYGYEGEVLLPVELRVAPGFAAAEPVRIAARADWLVCSDVCLPRGADLELTLPVQAGPVAADPRWRALFERSLKGLAAQAVAGASASTRDGVIELMLPGLRPASTAGVYVFPAVEGLVEHSAPQRVRQLADGLLVTLAVSRQLSAGEPRIAGIVSGLGERPLAFEAQMTGTLAPGTGTAPAAPVQTLTPWLGFVFAVFGGLLLNLMPCVFPVLSLKILGFAKSGDSAATRLQGVAFAIGVIGSFVALAGLLIALRTAGEAVGWGFQLQSPLVVTLLALLFFLLALNLSGVFEFGSVVPAHLAGKSLKHPLADSFFSGVLAALVASPCTAPFMGAALGYALTQDVATALLVFAAMGAGMALPYVVLAFNPVLLRRLPRPGPWLASFKQAMAFPLYATVVWLAWVLLVQVGADGIVRLGAGLVTLAFAAWLLGRAQRGTVRAAAVAAMLAAAWLAAPAGTAQPAQAAEGWKPFSASAIAELNASGQAVFVDFTAAWCVTCQVNKKVVLESAPVRAAFASKDLVLMRADWTRRDPDITAALAGFGRSGVPVYVLHVPGRSPQLLPEILSERIMLDALAPIPRKES
ncbi:MAG: protein-disulfide reductase DsbD family protein [Burkholderiales bacterium]